MEKRQTDRFEFTTEKEKELEKMLQDKDFESFLDFLEENFPPAPIITYNTEEKVQHELPKTTQDKNYDRH